MDHLGCPIGRSRWNRVQTFSILRRPPSFVPRQRISRLVTEGNFGPFLSLSRLLARSASTPLLAHYVGCTVVV